ncbi:coiled-coil domain-containing protein 124-like [Ptychodera flava]|uniref:coiled-coil domain-containing protein 124-like n=1 Tax=Ptychodera flava TaxID=63121 RepID=UPI003969F70D
MPKKFKGENTKATAARARKAEARAQEESRKQKELEDEYWRDDDKSAAKKQERKAGKERKKQEELERKAAARKALEEEEAALAKTSAKQTPNKLTRAQIQQQIESQPKATPTRALSHDETPLEENPNRLLEEGAVEARSVEDAIAVLSVKEAEKDRHPEKRMKAAYAAYEQENLPRLKAENPNMRLSQVKQMLKKDWMKAPENPMNQRYQEYNAGR